MSSRPQDCPDGVRTRVSQTRFGARFLTSVPVLQWAKHATAEQHRRLSQFPGAHGWGGIDYAGKESTCRRCVTSCPLAAHEETNLRR